MTQDGLSQFINLVKSPGDSLRQKALHSGFWAGFLNVSDRGLQIFKLLILGNILAPASFGILGIALLTKMMLWQLTQLGLNTALIQQKEENIDEYLDTAWSINLFRGLCIFAAVFVTAPFIADVFREPLAGPVIQVIGISVILDSLINPATVYFQKELEFYKEYIFNFSKSIVDVVVTITAALIWQSVWALVVGLLLSGVVKVIASYLLHSYRPKLAFKTEKAKEMLTFGKWIWVTSLVTFMATSGDDAFVGWYLSAGALGLYQMAFRLSNAPATEVTQTIASVSLPLFSKLQDDKNRLKKAYLRMFGLTSVIGLPMAIGIILVAPEFTEFALGDKWIEMVPAMQIMAIAGLFRAYGKTGGVLFQGYGSPHWDFRMNLVRVITIIVSIAPLTSRWGITGTALAITLGMGSALPIWAFKSKEITQAKVSDFIEHLLPAAVATAIMMVPVSIIVAPTLMHIVAAVFCGIGVYTIILASVYQFQGRSLLAELIS
ncbi:lipopolysaccharide biosynthesis protein [Haladaptatus sp. DYSN1]|uniref:lipopolysaccharide biosynthesis protein n=1 Tax=unclassified Haladaptatus TaxID=2622732 RepID=UPI0024051E60|nr:lipopolysaccharide biosynthesis protein [Haladaptatus sp. DYSN1]